MNTKLSDLSDSNRSTIVSALQSWFISQDIALDLACIVMQDLQAKLLFERTKDINQLSIGIKLLNTYLLHEVAARVRGDTK